MNDQREGYFASADALRATAILLVILNHLFTFTKPMIGHHELELGYLGVWGVNCFFLLSGCLLAGPFIRVLLDPTRTWPSTREFYTRRFLRIYPLYLVSVVFSIVVMGLLVKIPMTWPAVLSAVLMLQNLSTDTIVAISPPLWTMGIDAAFYLVLPPAAFVLGKFIVRGDYARRVKTLCWSLAAIIALCLVYRFVAYTTHSAGLDVFAISAVYARNLAGMLTAFILGIGLALIRAIARPGDMLRASTYLTAIVLGVTIATVEFLLRLGSERGAVYSLAGVLRATVVDPLAAVSCALIFFGLAQGNLRVIQPLFRSPYVTTFATLAYAVYLFHYPILAFIHRQFLHNALGFVALVELAITSIAVTLPVAILAHHFIEQPFLVMKNRHRDPGTRVKPTTIAEVATQ